MRILSSLETAWRSGVLQAAVLAAALCGMASGAAEAGNAARAPLPVAPWSRTAPVDFESEVLPIFQRNCLACHNQTRAKGELNLETPQSALKGGSSGAGLVPGRAEESLLFRAAAHLAEDMIMPPAGNKANASDLTPGELALLKAWIDQGARGEVHGAGRIAWSGMPEGWAPSFAVALSADGRWAAAARAHRVEVYEVATRQRVARLQDPALEGAAHRDVVNALAFSPDGQWLASAGFREVKLWRAVSAGPGNPAGPAPSTPWTAFSRSRDGRRQAAGTQEGVLLLMDGAGSVVRTLHVGSGSLGALVFSPDGLRLATVVGESDLVLVDVESGVARHATVPARAVRALVWLEDGHELGAVMEGSGRVARWRLPEDWASAGELDALPEREVMSVGVVSAGNVGPRGEQIFFVGSDGAVAVYAPGGAEPVRRLPAGAPVVAGVVSEDSSHAALAAADGVIRVWRLGEEPKALAEMSGDPGWALALARTAQSVAFLKSEIEFQKGAQQRADEEVRKTTDVLAKATTRHGENEKTLAAKQGELKTQVEARSGAEKERTELAASLKQAEEAAATAEARMAERKSAAREASETAAATRTSAELASRTRSDLSRLVSEFAEKAEAQAAEKVRALATAADGEAEQKRKSAQEAEARVVEQLDALASAAVAAGQAKAALERAKAEIPPRQKAAEDKVAALAKAVGDLEAQVKKAEIGVSTSLGDVTLARTQLDNASRSLAEAKSAREKHESALPAAEAAWAQAKSEAGRDASSLVQRLALSPGGAQMVVGRASGRVQVWDVPSGRLRESWTPEGAGADGTWIEVGFEGAGGVQVATARGWERRPLERRWEWVRTLGGDRVEARSGFQDRVNALAFTDDGRTLLTAGGEPTRGGELKAWTVPEGALARDYGAVHSDAVLSLALSPEGESLLTGGADRFMRLVDRASGRVLRQFEGHTHHVMGVAWLRDGRTVASAGAEAVVKLWNRQTGDRLRNVDGFGKEVVSIQPVGVESQFVAASGAGQVRVFKTGGEAVRSLEAKGAFLHALAVTPDGRLAAAGDATGVVRVWSLEDGKVLAEWAAAD